VFESSFTLVFTMLTYSRKGRWALSLPLSFAPLVEFCDEISGKSTTGGGDPTDRAQNGEIGTCSDDVCHTPFRDSGNEAFIRVPRMFHSHV
jgi:hypothetical protein